MRVFNHAIQQQRTLCFQRIAKTFPLVTLRITIVAEGKVSAAFDEVDRQLAVHLLLEAV